MHHLSIGIVGAGAVAKALGRAMHAAGLPVIAVVGSVPSQAEATAAFIDASVAVVSLQELVTRVGRVIIATSDQRVTPIAGALAAAGFENGIALHTSGAQGPAALEPLLARRVHCGVLHPLQTVVARAGRTTGFSDVTFGIGGDPEAVDWARQIVGSLGGHAVLVRADAFPLYHAGAVMAGNGIIAVIDAAVTLMVEAGFDRDAALRSLAPLARAATDNTLALGPEQALTGPVARGDAATVGKHFAAIESAAPGSGALYRELSRGLLDIARRRGLSDASHAAIAAILASPHAGGDLHERIAGSHS